MKVLNHPQPPTITQKTTHNYPQSSTITQKLPQKTQNLSQLCYYTLDVSTETDADFDSDMKQWYIYLCMSVCIYFISYYIYYFLFRLIVYFVSIKSNLFDAKSDEFCFLRIWIYELLLINIKQRSVQQSTVSAHELPYEFLRMLSIFRGKFYCLSLATVTVDINVETLKENGILLSQFTQNV